MPEPEGVENAEVTIRHAWDAGGASAATTETLQRYGREIMGLLVGLHHDEDEAGDVFSAFSERLWLTFDRFEWKCSVRTWAYLLARRASVDVRRQRKGARVPLSNASELSALVARVRTETLTYLRTETKDEVARLRDALPEDDRLLLILRVDRELAWDDLARVFLEGDDGASPEALKRESARLRKRFQLVKERILEMGRKKGLFPG
jgi:RNA polymerase sigma-70 factor (ECF subfamily)